MLSYAFTTIFMCFFYSCAQSLSTLHTGIPSWYGFILCAAFFSPRFAHVGLLFCLSNPLGSVFSHACSLLLRCWILCSWSSAYSHSHYLLLTLFCSRTAALRTYFRPLSWLKSEGVCSACLVFCVCFSLAFWKILSLSCCSTFQSKSSPICFCSQFKAHTSSPSSLLPFCRWFSFIRSYSARYPISCLLPLFRLQSWFSSAAPTFELCSSTRHFAFVRPMFSDLSLRIPISSECSA